MYRKKGFVEVITESSAEIAERKSLRGQAESGWIERPIMFDEIINLENGGNETGYKRVSLIGDIAVWGKSFYQRKDFDIISRAILEENEVILNNSPVDHSCKAYLKSPINPEESVLIEYIVLFPERRNCPMQIVVLDSRIIEE